VAAIHESTYGVPRKIGAIAEQAMTYAMFVDYVACHIIDIMFPVALCGGASGGARGAWRGTGLWPHNAYRDCSHFRSDGSSRQIAPLGDATPA